MNFVDMAKEKTRLQEEISDLSSKLTVSQSKLKYLAFQDKVYRIIFNTFEADDNTIESVTKAIMDEIEKFDHA